jgi:hypothetical protein
VTDGAECQSSLWGLRINGTAVSSKGGCLRNDLSIEGAQKIATSKMLMKITLNPILNYMIVLMYI